MKAFHLEASVTNKPSVDEFRTMVRAFFTMRREHDPDKQAEKYADFQRTAIGIPLSLVDASLPESDAARNEHIHNLETEIVAASKTWAYQHLLVGVYGREDDSQGK